MTNRIFVAMLVIPAALLLLFSKRVVDEDETYFLQQQDTETEFTATFVPSSGPALAYDGTSAGIVNNKKELIKAGDRPAANLQRRESCRLLI